MTKTVRLVLTGVTQGHAHEVEEGDRETGPPQGDPGGHRHPVIQDGDDIRLGEAEGHSHDLPESFAMKRKRNNVEAGDDYISESYQEAKTVDGVGFPASDWAFVPDPDKPSTWKLRLTSEPGGAPDPRIVGAAVAAIGPGGFRGRRVEIPEEDRPAVLKRVRAAWLKANPDKEAKDLPEVLTRRTFESDELFDLTGVEIFRTGEWNGDKYDTRDLDDMVANFERVGFRPPLKLGHADNSGEPAYGWVKSIRRVGDRLVADFMDLPKRVFEAIKNRRFDHVSSEIFWNLKRGGRTFRRALKAVALLGTETPGVADLKPLRDSVAGLKDITYDGLMAYDLSKEDLMSDKKTPSAEELAAQVKDLTEKLEAAEKAAKEAKAGSEKPDGKLAQTVKEMSERLEQAEAEVKASKERERQARIDKEIDKLRVPAYRDYFRALFDLATLSEGKTVKFKTEVKNAENKLETVEQDTSPWDIVSGLVDRINKGAEHLFREHARHDAVNRHGEFAGDDPGVEVDKLTKAYMVKHNTDDYRAALHKVLDDPENAELARRYNHS